MEFGPEIAIEGKRPDWVKDNTICAVCNDGQWFGLGVQIEAREWCAWESPCAYTAIRLPADHPHYVQALAEHALEAQYKGEPLPGAEAIAAMQEPRGQSFGTVAELMDDLNDAVRLNRVSRQEAEDHNWDIATLIDFGLLADATDIERFEQHHGGLDNNQRDIAEAAIKWARGNS